MVCPYEDQLITQLPRSELEIGEARLFVRLRKAAYVSDRRSRSATKLSRIYDEQ